MKDISSYKQLVKERKKIQLQRKFMENEILYLHEKPESETQGILGFLSNIHPRDMIKVWDIGAFLIRKFRTKEKEQD